MEARAQRSSMADIDVSDQSVGTSRDSSKMSREGGFLVSKEESIGLRLDRLEQKMEKQKEMWEKFFATVMARVQNLPNSRLSIAEVCEDVLVALNRLQETTLEIQTEPESCVAEIIVDSKQETYSDEEMVSQKALLGKHQEIEVKDVQKQIQSTEIDDLIQEDELQKANEEITETYSDPQPQVLCAILEPSLRYKNSSRFVLDELQDVIVMVRSKRFQSGFEFVNGHASGVQLFDKMLNRRKNSPPKTWKFKFKDRLEKDGNCDEYLALFLKIPGMENDSLDKEQAISALWKYPLSGTLSFVEQNRRNVIDEQRSMSWMISLWRSGYKAVFDGDGGRQRREEDRVKILKAREENLLEQQREALPHFASTVSLDQKFISCVWFDKRDLLIGATNQIRMLLCGETFNSSVKEAIQADLVSYFVEFVTWDDSPELQFEVVWALTNIAFGILENTEVGIDHGAVALLVKLLSSPHKRSSEHVVWALGNISEQSPKCSDMIFGHGVLTSLLQFNHGAKNFMLVNAIWNLSKAYQENIRQHKYELVNMIFSLKIELQQTTRSMDNAFQKSLDERERKLNFRTVSVIVFGLKIAGVGVGSSFTVVGASNALCVVRKFIKPELVVAQKHKCSPLLNAALVYGAFLEVSANLRYVRNQKNDLVNRNCSPQLELQQADEGVLYVDINIDRVKWEEEAFYAIDRAMIISSHKFGDHLSSIGHIQHILTGIEWSLEKCLTHSVLKEKPKLNSLKVESSTELEAWRMKLLKKGEIEQKLVVYKCMR